MALEALLARLDGRAVTSVTDGAIADVTGKPDPESVSTPLKLVAVTSVTCVTPQIDNGRGTAGEVANASEVFEFAQNSDYTTDQEAHRQRCWQAFQRNAQRILAAPPFNRNALIKKYRADACVRYGEATAADMAGSLRNWIDVRGVH